MKRIIAVFLVLSALFFALLMLATATDFFRQEPVNCPSFSSQDCPSPCVVCPPCAACSSIGCQSEEFCQSIGFDKNWYSIVTPHRTE